MFSIAKNIKEEIMIDNILFLLVFLGQILFGSYFIPQKILMRMAQVCNKYPPEKYPKLYPESIDHYYRGQRRYKVMNEVVLGIGLVILGMVIHYDFSNKENISEAIPVIYFFIQFVPLVLLEISEFSYFKKMRNADTRSSKTANLQPRSLFNFVSPILVLFAGILILTYIGLDIYVNKDIHQFTFDWHDKTVIRISNIVVVNLIFAGIIYWNIYGKKLDPYQASVDRNKSIAITVKSLVSMSVFVSLFLIFWESTDDLGLDKYQPVFISLYLIAIIFISTGARLKSLKLEENNFEVYKGEAS